MSNGKRFFRRKLRITKAVSITASILLVSTIGIFGVSAKEPTYQPIVSNAYDAVREQLENAKPQDALEYLCGAKEGKKSITSEDLWSYSEMDYTNQTPSGIFENVQLDYGKKTGIADYDNYFKNGMFATGTQRHFMAIANGNGPYWSSEGKITAVFLNAIHYDGFIPALTYTAPYAGTGKLKGFDVRAEGCWQLNESGDEIKIEVYKNNEKIWPSNENDGKMIYGKQYTTVPEIALSLAKGDKIHIAVIPVKNDYGWVCFNTQVKYELSNNTDWSYSYKSVVTNETTGKYEPDCSKDWIQPPLAIPSNLWHFLNQANGDIGYLSTTNDSMSAGYGLTKDGKVGAFINQNIGAIAYTYTAPKTGILSIANSSANKKIQHTNWNGAEFGFAVYRNNDKVWPKTGYYEFANGQWEKDFPVMDRLEVKKGDKVHIAFISRNDGNYNYVKFAPQVTLVDGMLGDINSDGSINSGDLTVMRKYLIGIENNINLNAADFDNNDRVDILDLIKLKKKLCNVE